MKDALVPAGRILALSELWEREAAQRKARTPGDPAVDAITSCASELKNCIEQVERDTAYLSVAEYARLHDVSPQTVRRLCAARLIDGAEKDMKDDWRIPRDAKRRAKSA